MAGIIGLIGGSGLGDVLAEHITNQKSEKLDTPFGKPSSDILMGKIADSDIAFINRHGQGHKFGPSDVPYAANIYALKQIGVSACIATAAVGSLRQQIKPKDLIVPEQIIDKTFRRKGSFFDNIAAVHCEMAAPYCGRVREAILRCGDNIKADVHNSGVYVCMEGPGFSTRAESLMHRAWGGDLIGMTAMPEAKLAREAQMCFALVAMASDYDCWKEPSEVKDKQELLAEIIGNLTEATDNAIELIKQVLKAGEQLCDDGCPCRHSLDMAVWTKPEQIAEQDKKIIEVLKR